MKFALPEKMPALAMSHSGTYCVGGSVTGKLYVWEVASGELLRVFDAHYGKINVLRFTDDDALLLSGGEDATVNVWELGALLNESLETAITTLFSWTDHSLAITDIHVGFGGAAARVITSSLDCTCKVWDLGRGGALLSTLIFPVYISTATMDPCEYRIFGGGGNGEIYVAELYPFTPETGYQALGGQEAVEKKPQNMFVGHTAPITSLSTSFDGTLLLSSSEDSKAIVWDIRCRQMLRTFSQHKGPINFATIIPRPNADLFSTTLPTLPPFAQFKRFAKVRGAESATQEGAPITLDRRAMDRLPHLVPVLTTPLVAPFPLKLAPPRTTAPDSLEDQTKKAAKAQEENQKLKRQHQDAVNQLLTETKNLEATSPVSPLANREPGKGGMNQSKKKKSSSS